MFAVPEIPVVHDEVTLVALIVARAEEMYTSGDCTDE